MSENLTHVGRYQLKSCIGAGSYGIVKSKRAPPHPLPVVGVDSASGLRYACKLLPKEEIREDKNIVLKVKKEFQILSQLQHPNIIRLVEKVETKSELMFVTELAEGGDLFEHIVRHGEVSFEFNFKFSELKAKRIFAQIVSGLTYLHHKGFAHRDLKPENIFMDAKESIKIGDFGFSTFNKDGITLRTFCGSPNYAAPEVLRHEQYDGAKADIWSLGVVLYAMLTRHLPFDDDNVARVARQIELAQFKIPSHLSPPVCDLLSLMLQPNALKRVTIDEIS